MNNHTIAVFKNALEIYTYLCQPVCKEYNIQQPALDILYYLSKNPERNTAVDIGKQEGIKQSMISYHVDRLVNDGYLERLSVPGDRRKVKLVCTDKAACLTEKCGEIRARMTKLISDGISEKETEVYERVSKKIFVNIQNCRELMLKGEL